MTLKKYLVIIGLVALIVGMVIFGNLPLRLDGFRLDGCTGGYPPYEMTITGYVKEANVGVSGVTVKISFPQHGSTTTSNSGYYSLTYTENHDEAVHRIFVTKDGYEPKIGTYLTFCSSDVPSGEASLDLGTISISKLASPPPPEDPLQADFDFSIDRLVVEFAPIVTGGTGDYVYFWDFGDSQTSNSEAPAHIYGQSGTYTVEVVVTDSSGTSTQKTKIIVTTVEGPTLLPPIGIVLLAIGTIALLGGVLGGVIFKRKLYTKIGIPIGAILLIFGMLFIFEVF